MVVIMIKEIKVNKSNKSIIFINNGIAFSQFGVADEILDLIINLQKCYCNRTDCSGRIKDNKKYDSLQQRIDKAYNHLINSKEYKMAKEISLNDKQSILIKLEKDLQGDDKE